MTEANWMVTGQTLDRYLEACRTAQMSNFKQDPRLTKIFEHATRRQGWEYLRIIAKQHPSWFEYPFTNDAIGEPTLHSYGMVTASASTLQYIAVLSNLVARFGSLDGLRIVEIGGGYGGQCRTILDMFKPASYTLIDLPEPLGLQQRYLAATPTKVADVRFHALMQNEDYDLCISNYALSEIKEPDGYIDGVLRKATHGYITCNTDLIQLDWPHEKLSDLVSEAKGNYILVW